MTPPPKDSESDAGAISSAFVLLRECEPFVKKSPFSYICRGCAECCKNKRIPVFPFDVLQLARLFCISTGEVIEQFIDTEQSFLKHSSAGGCMFLEDRQCRVYSARPIVCRLYPLQRHKSDSFSEIYGLMQPEPKTKGMYGTAGTVKSFLEAQNVGQLLEYLDRYLKLVGESPEFRESRWLDVDAVVDKSSFEPPSLLLEDWKTVLEAYYSLLEQQN